MSCLLKPEYLTFSKAHSPVSKSVVKSGGYIRDLNFLCLSMSLFITSIASGSNGNCYYIGNSTDAVLVDVGISCREVERRMKRLGLTLQKVKAVFISHEHSDHIQGLS